RSINQAVDFEITRGDREQALNRRQVRNERGIRNWAAEYFLRLRFVRRISPTEMKLTEQNRPALSGLRGLTSVPPVILLPVLAALAYILLYKIGNVELLRFEETLVTESNFVFLPTLELPLAIILAIGLWLYARVGCLQALLA